MTQKRGPLVIYEYVYLQMYVECIHIYFFIRACYHKINYKEVIFPLRWITLCDISRNICLPLPKDQIRYENVLESLCKMAFKRKRQIYHLWMCILFPIFAICGILYEVLFQLNTRKAQDSMKMKYMELLKSTSFRSNSDLCIP